MGRVKNLCLVQGLSNFGYFLFVFYSHTILFFPLQWVWHEYATITAQIVRKKHTKERLHSELRNHWQLNSWKPLHQIELFFFFFFFFFFWGGGGGGEGFSCGDTVCRVNVNILLFDAVYREKLNTAFLFQLERQMWKQSFLLQLVRRCM